MACPVYLRNALMLAMLFSPFTAAQAQNYALNDPQNNAQDGAPEVPLGDLARSFRRQEVPQRPDVIDNDNLSELMEMSQTNRGGATPLFSFDNLGKHFQVSSPDVTCSLSFNAKATSLLTNPYALQELPPAELVKLEGPATIEDGNLQISVLNDSPWTIYELTVGVTMVRKPTLVSSNLGPRLIPAAVSESALISEGRPSDSTVLYHVKGSAAPFTAATFSASLTTPLAPEQEWHWAILSAKGLPGK